MKIEITNYAFSKNLCHAFRVFASILIFSIISDLSDLFAHIKLVIPSYLSQAWFEQTELLHNSFINWSQVSNFHFFNQYFRWSKLPTMTPESQKTLITSCWDFTYQLWYWVQLSTSSCYAQFFPPKSYGLNQGNLLRGIDNKTVWSFRFVCIHKLFSNTRFLR